MVFKDSTELLKALFPIPDESLEHGVELLNETQVEIEEFRLFFYWMLMGDGYRCIDLSYNGIAYYFFCYATEKIAHDLAPFVLNKPDLKVELSFMDSMLNSVKSLEKRTSPEARIKEEETREPMSELELEEYYSSKEQEESSYDLFCDLHINNEYETPYFELNNSGSFSIPFDERLNEFVQDFENFIGRVPEEKQTKLFKWLVNEVYKDFGREYGIKRKKPDNILKFKTMIPARN